MNLFVISSFVIFVFCFLSETFYAFFFLNLLDNEWRVCSLLRRKKVEGDSGVHSIGRCSCLAVGSCSKWKWTEKAAATCRNTCHAHTAAGHPIPSRLLHCIYVTRVLLLNISFRTTPFPFHQSSYICWIVDAISYLPWRLLYDGIADIFSFVPKRKKKKGFGVSVTDVWSRLRDPKVRVYPTTSQRRTFSDLKKKTEHNPKKNSSLKWANIWGKVECRRRGSWEWRNQNRHTKLLKKNKNKTQIRGVIIILLFFDFAFISYIINIITYIFHSVSLSVYQ